jgi:hypothetical protein
VRSRRAGPECHWYGSTHRAWQTPPRSPCSVRVGVGLVLAVRLVGPRFWLSEAVPGRLCVWASPSPLTRASTRTEGKRGVPFTLRYRGRAMREVLNATWWNALP